MKAAVLAVLMSTTAGAGDVVLRIDRPSTLAVPAPDPARSKVVDLPPGYFFPDSAFQTLDIEIKRLQRIERAAGPSALAVVIAAGLGLVVGAGTVVALRAACAPR